MIIGIDEVGRGCWAGPLVAAAVGLGDDRIIEGLNDSKKITVKARQNLIIEIRKNTTMIGVGWVWPNEINMLKLTKSVQLAMQRAVEKIESHIKNNKIIIDGNINFLPDFKNSQAIIKADGSIPAVSAASIVAKIARDSYMQKIAAKYPEYGFEKHVGYGTKLHIEALYKNGITPIHRLNYKPIKRFIADQSPKLYS